MPKKVSKSKASKKPQPAERQSVVVSMLLDESGSMQHLRDATINGFNEYVDGLKKSLGDHDVHFSALKFDDPRGVIKLQVGAPIQNAIKLDYSNYSPSGGTPLNDAVARTIQATDEVAGKNKASKIIVVIQTDGFENASRDFTTQQIKQMVEKRQGKGWEFVFIGAGIDAFAMGQNFGFAAMNTMSYTGSGEATMDMFAATASNTAAYATGQSQNMNYSVGQSRLVGESASILKAKLKASKPTGKTA